MAIQSDPSAELEKMIQINRSVEKVFIKCPLHLKDECDREVAKYKSWGFTKEEVNKEAGLPGERYQSIVLTRPN
jgi:hypothetical protein